MASPPMQIPLDRDDALRHLRTLLLVDIQYHQEAYEHQIRMSRNTLHASEKLRILHQQQSTLTVFPPDPAPCSICVGVALYVMDCSLRVLTGLA